MPLRRRIFSVIIMLFIAIAVAVATFVVFNVDSFWADRIKVSTPVFAALASTAALIGATAQYFETSQRQAILNTIEGHSRWSDATWESRHHLTRVLGEGVLSEKIARAFAEESELADIEWPSGNAPSLEDRERLFREMVSVLNGLERLSIAVHRGAYDLDTLHTLAGTVIVRQWERYEPYVKARRSARRPMRRQTRTFTNLEELAQVLKSRRLKDQKKEVDRDYLSRLSTG